MTDMAWSGLGLGVGLIFDWVMGVVFGLRVSTHYKADLAIIQ